jgi:hypothetical protein
VQSLDDAGDGGRFVVRQGPGPQADDKVEQEGTVTQASTDGECIGLELPRPVNLPRRLQEVDGVLDRLFIQEYQYPLHGRTRPFRSR